eukprot:124189_1
MEWTQQTIMSFTAHISYRFAASSLLASIMLVHAMNASIDLTIHHILTFFYLIFCESTKVSLNTWLNYRPSSLMCTLFHPKLRIEMIWLLWTSKEWFNLFLVINAIGNQHVVSHGPIEI